MKSLITRALIAGAVVLSAGAARAETAGSASVSVVYLVHRKPLISSLTAASQLDIQFFSDASCNVAAGNVQMSASDPGISIERVKRQRIKGLRGSDFLRIDALVPKAPIGSYVRVEGPGVVAAKQTCQPQGAGGLDALRLVDSTMIEQILTLANVDSIEELTAALQAGDLETPVVCEIIGTILGGAGIEVPVDTCAIGEETGPLATLQGLVGGLDLGNLGN